MNAVTPFDTASTPVIAAQPLANAFSSSQMREVLHGRGHRRWRGRDRDRVPMRRDGVHNAHNDRGQQRPHKQERRQHEHKARFLHAPQIDDHNDGQDHQAKRKLVRMQRGTALTSAVTPAEIPTAAVRT